MSEWHFDPSIFPDEDTEKKKKKQLGLVPVQPRSDFEIPTVIKKAEKSVSTDISQEPEGDWGDFFSALGGHALSSATMGLTEFSDDLRNKAWGEKNAHELWGAALGEAAGFLVPIGLIGKGVRAVGSGLKTGVRSIAKQTAKETADLAGTNIAKTVGKEATQETTEAAARNIIRKTLEHESGATIIGKSPKYLYQLEVGGETAAKASSKIGQILTAKLSTNLSEAGIKVTGKQIDDIVTGFTKGIQEGKHYNTLGSWLNHYSRSAPTGGFWKSKFSKWAGEATDEALVLTMDSVMRDYIRSKYTSDDKVPHKFAPGTAAGHGILLGAIFPFIRSGFGLPLFKKGGKEKLTDGARIMFNQWKKTDYAKLAETQQGRSTLKGFLEMLNGKKNITEWTSKKVKITRTGANGKPITEELLLDDILNMNLSSKEGGKIARQALEQIRSSVSTPKALANWALKWSMDTAVSIPRMAVGSAAMNWQSIIDPSMSNASIHEILPHMMIGAFMTKSRRGWMEGEMASRNVDNYFEMARYLDIDTKALADVVNYHKARQDVAINSRGMLGSDSANEIFDIYDIEMREARKHNQRTTVGTEHQIVKDWYDIYHRRGLVEDLDFNILDLEYLSKKQLNTIAGKLETIEYNGKKLSEFTPNEWFNLERINWNQGVEGSHIRFLKRLNDLGVVDFNVDTKQVGRVNREGGNEHIKVDRMILRLHDLGLVKITTHLGEKGKDISPEVIREASESFKDGLRADAVGEGIHVPIELNDNLFLDEMHAVRRIQTEEILQKSVVGDNEGLSPVQQDYRKRAIDPFLLDSKGNMVDPVRIEVTEKDIPDLTRKKMNDSDVAFAEKDRAQLESDLREIASVYHAGTSEKSMTGEVKKLSYEEAKSIVDGFKEMQLPISAERLISDGILSSQIAYKVKVRRFQKKFPDRLQYELVTDLEDAGLGWWNPEAEQFYVYDYRTASLMSGETGTSRARDNMYAQLLSYLGDKVQTTGDLTRQQPVDMTAIKRIHSKIPEVRKKMIVEKIVGLRDKLASIDLLEGENSIKALEDALSDSDGTKALQALEAIAEKLPAVREEILRVKGSLERDLSRGKIFEDALLNTDIYNKDLGLWINALKEAFVTEGRSRNDAEKLLSMMLNERDNSLFYIKNLTKEIEKTVERPGASLEDLALEFAQTHGLAEWKRMVNAVYLSRQKPMETDLYYHENEANFAADIRNDAGSVSRNSVKIIADYDLGKNGELKIEVVEQLKTPEGVSNLVADITDKFGQRAGENFLRNDLGVLLRDSGLQERITRVTYKDGNLEFEFDVASSRTRAREIINEFNDEGIVIYEASGNAMDKGRKPLELISDLSSKIRSAKVRVSQKEDLKRFNEGAHEDISIGNSKEALERVDGSYEVLITGYTKPLFFKSSKENIAAINKKFNNDLVQILADAPGGANGEIAQNISRAFENTSNAALQLRALYWFKTNGKLAYDLFMNDNVSSLEAMSEASRKYIKYSTLFANELSKPVSRESLERFLESNTELSNETRRSIETIVNEFDNIGVVPVLDESFARTFIGKDGSIAETNIFNNRLNHVRQIEIDQSLPKDMRKHLSEKYSNEEFINSLNTSGWDGIIIISKDMYLTSMAMRPEGSNSNALKPTVWHNSGVSTVLGKGLYAYIPEISDVMPRGVHMIMSGSAVKSLRGRSRAGNEIVPLDGSNLTTGADIVNPSMENIIDISFADQGIIKSSHGLTNAPISHTITYGKSKNLVDKTRVWMQLDEIISKAVGWDAHMKNAASSNLAQVLARMEKEGGYEAEGLGFVNEMVNVYGFHHTMPLVKKSIFRMFKDRMLTKINKPTADGKQGRYYILPDMTLKNPYFTTMSKDASTIEVQTQFGEISLPYEYALGMTRGNRALRSVDSMQELQFSFNENGVDYMFTVNGDGTYKIYNNIEAYQKEGFTLPYAHKAPMEVPAGVREIIESLSGVMKSDEGTYWLGSGNDFTLGRVATVYNQLAKEAGINTNILTMVERSPRKGQSDFVLTKIRDVMPRDLGAIAKVNSYDVRVALQGDWDGDAVTIFHGQPWDVAKEANFDSGLIPDYVNLTSSPKMLNPFGIELGGPNRGRAGLSQANTIEAYMQYTRQVERTMGKVLGMNNAVSWMANSKITIDGMDINMGFSNAEKISNRARLNHFANASQSIADASKGVNQDLLNNPVNTIFFNEGTELFGTSRQSNKLHREMAGIVLDVLRRPANIFNDITDQAGKHKPRVDEMDGMYADLRSFFSDPNTYVFKEILRRNKGMSDAEMTQLLHMFFGENISKDLKSLGDIIKRAKSKRGLRPTKNIIKFGDEFKKGLRYDADKLMDLSDSGEIIREISKNHLFNDRGFIEAWNISSDSKEVSRYANIVSNAEQVFELGRLLGAKDAEMMDMGMFDTIFDGFQLPKGSDIKKAEHVAMLETALTYEYERAVGYLRYLRGYKSSNSYQVSKAQDRVMALGRAQDMLDIKIKQIALPESQLQKIKIIELKGQRTRLSRPDGQKGYSYFYKIKDKNFVKRDVDGNIVDVNYQAIDRNPIIVQAGESISRDQYGNKLFGHYIELKNPIASRRLNNEDTLTGYMSYLWTKNNPLTTIFPDSWSRFSIDAGENSVFATRKAITSSWSRSISRLKKGAEYAPEIFTLGDAEIAEALSRYYEDHSKMMIREDGFSMEGLTVEGLSSSKTQVYYLTKTLLTPTPLARMKVSSDVGAAPYFYINKTLLDKTMQYLYRNNPEVARVVGEELGQVYDFMIGRGEMPYMTKDKSGFYTGKNFMGIENIPTLAERPDALVRFNITPDLGLGMQSRGVMYMGDVQRTSGGVSFREIKSLVDKTIKWEDTKSPSCD